MKFYSSNCYSPAACSSIHHRPYGAIKCSSVIPVSSPVYYHLSVVQHSLWVSRVISVTALPLLWIPVGQFICRTSWLSRSAHRRGYLWTTYTLRKKGSSMVLQNSQRFYLKPFAIWTRLKDLQTILSCEEPLKVLHFPVKNL